jgi:hypothetical protein
MQLSEKPFESQGGIRKAGTSSLKRVTGRISQQVSDFISQKDSQKL